MLVHFCKVKWKRHSVNYRSLKRPHQCNTTFCPKNKIRPHQHQHCVHILREILVYRLFSGNKKQILHFWKRKKIIYRAGTIHSIYGNRDKVASWLSLQRLKEQPPGRSPQWEESHSVKYVASTTNRFKVRDLEDFKDEKTHRVEGRTELQHHAFYYSILKPAMKRTQQKPLWRGWPWLDHDNFQGASSLWCYTDLLFSFIYLIFK